MKTIATINFKGGVGKTTVTWCLGDVLSTITQSRSLLFDLDAQMSLTQALSLDADGNAPRKFAAWMEANRQSQRTLIAAFRQFVGKGKFYFDINDEFVYRLRNNYHFVPSTEQLYWLELQHGSVDPAKGKFFIKELLGHIEGSAALPKYDFALFDCPPSFTLLSYSVLTCCDLILVPANPDFFAAKGIELLLAGLKERIKPHPLPAIAVFANRVKTWAGKPTSRARAWIADMESTCKIARTRWDINVHYLDAWIPDRVSIRDAITARKTPSEPAQDFLKLWEEANRKLP